MPSMDLSRRMEDYFRRQISWLEQILSELGGFEEDLAGSELEKLAGHRKAHVEGAEALAQEFDALEKEWHGAEEGLPEEEQAKVRALSRRAAELAERVRAVQGEAESLVSKRLAGVKERWDRLRRGRDMLEKYRPNGGAAARFVDRKI